MRRLGHESITTTIDTYGHLLPIGGDLISQVVDTALRSEEIHPAPAMRLVQAGRDTLSEGIPPSRGTGWQNEAVTTRERLHLLVDDMDDEQVERALHAIEPIARSTSADAEPGHRPMPNFVGSFASGRPDLSQRVDELLADGFGR